VFQSCGEVPPRERQLCNNATSHKLIGNRTLKEVKILYNALHLMRMFHHRTVVHHPVVMETLHEVQFIACICCIIRINQSILERLRLCLINVHMDQAI